MTGFPQKFSGAIINLIANEKIYVQINYSYFFMKIAILVSKYTPKRINRNMFSKISSLEMPHSKRVSKIFIFYIKNGNF